MKKDFFFKNGKFNILRYAEKQPFTDFLPAIAGLDGCPLWAFYVNRGQGIAGFGVGGKDRPIMEFSPAEIAYANAPRQGFRTFLKIDGKYVEPFEVGGKASTRMEIYRSGFGIEESARKYNIKIEYFGVPNQNYAALGRIVCYTNVTKQAQEVEYIDGLAQILPYGMSNGDHKECGNLLKSWAVAKGVEDGISYIKMRSSTADSADVNSVCGGNFFMPITDGDIIVDPTVVFGEDRTKSRATVFERDGVTASALASQATENKIFCSFVHGKKRVGPSESFVVCELIGKADSLKFVKALKATLDEEAFSAMQRSAVDEAEKIAEKVKTHTAYPLFDEYIQQSYFDNVLRGGMPTLVGGKPYYVYSRKHGDPERDYNAFYIEPKPYSSGNGNFRDIAQNRRNDIFVTPECDDFNIKYFFTLLQADGYNPLSLNGVRNICKTVPEKYSEHADFLSERFTVGDVKSRLHLDEAELDELIANSEQVCEAKFGEGYWSDHFVYLIDLVTNYLAMFPDKKDQLLYESSIGWFMSGVRLLPRNKRAVRTADGNVRRLYAIEEVGEDSRTTINGKPYTTNLASKLLFLALIKLATLDPIGAGIDMEGGKPGWCDALNGLPGLFGSNVADSLELRRLIETLINIEIWQGNIEWSSEQNEMFDSVLSMLERSISPQEFYFATGDCKEKYIEKAYGGFVGSTEIVDAEKVRKFLRLALDRVKEGHDRARELGDGWYPTYIAFDVTDSEPTSDGYVVPKAFKPRVLPHFAEGVAKGLIFDDGKLYTRAKQSKLYDEKLGLFKTSEPLDAESIEIGRIRSFPKGWLERESCFLHMSYKLLYALLNAGMYDEFYNEIKTGFVPFMNMERYGRSTIENSSFIVTSDYGSEREWGKGFQARLTGANAEVISMWLHIMGADKPFTAENDTLKFSLSPRLAKDMFDNGRVTFRLFGTTDITYINKSGKNTYDGVAVERYTLTSDDVSIDVSEIVGATAQDVRDGKYNKIEVILK